MHPGIIPLAARATDAKICLWQIKHRRVQTTAVCLCRGVYVFIGRVELCPSCGLCSGVCRQPQWVYVGVFMYSLAGWSFALPADYAPACADSRSGFMSGCLCIRWPGGAGSTVRNISYNSRGDALTTVYGFLRGLLFTVSHAYAM